MTSKTVQNFRRNKSFKKFIGLELTVTLGSFFLAWFIANGLYPLSPSLFAWIGAALPQPLTATGFQMAYIAGAAIIWLGSNVFLFASGLRRL